MVKNKFQRLFKYHYVKLISGLLFLLIFSPIQANASNSFTYIGDSILNAYSTYFIKPVSEKIAELFYAKVVAQPIIIYKTSKSTISVPKALTSSQKTIYVNSTAPNTYITNNYPTTTIYQSSGGGGGVYTDTSSFVTRSAFDAQVSGIHNSIVNNFNDLNSRLARSIVTSSLQVTGPASVGGDLTVVGNIIGNVVGTINPSFTLGSIPFQGASGLAENNTNFKWDNTTFHLTAADAATNSTYLNASGTPRGGTVLVLGGSEGAGEDGSIIVGPYASSLGGNNSYFNTIIGYSASSTANAPKNVIVGKGATTNQADTVVVGNAASTTGNRSIVIGSTSSSSAADSIVIGFATTTSTANAVAIGGSNSLFQIGGNFVPSARMHIKSLGTTSATYGLKVQNSSAGDLFTVRDDGNVGIGVVAPNTFKLEVAGGIGPEADNTRDIGSAVKRFANIYANNFVGGFTPNGFTLGSVVFAGSGGTLNQDNSGLFYDATNHSLGIGNTSPFSDLGLFRIVGAKVDSTFSGGALSSVRETSTYNTTSSTKTSYAMLISNTSTRSSGSNALTNVGLYISTSGAQNNYSAIFDQGNVGVGTTAPTFKLEVAGTFRASGNALIGTNIGAGTTTPINLSLGGTYGSNAAGNVGNLKIDLYNDGTANRSGFGISANKLEYQTPAGTVHAMYVGGNLIQSIDDNAVLIKSGLFSTTTYAQRIGNLLTQSYSSNNITMVDNGYYNGSSWTRAATGFASGIQMYNGHLMMVAGGTGTGNFTPTYPFKANSAGTVGIGGDGGNLANTFTGNTLVATSTAVGIGQSSPGFLLHVGSASVVDGTTVLRLQDANSTCDFNANAGAPTCGSDLTLKKNIASLNTNDLLTKVSSLNPVSYQWLTEEDTAPLQNGFIAQEVAEQFPELVTDHLWIDGSTKKFLNTGGLMPYVIGAVKEMNIKVTGINNLEAPNTWRDSLLTWFGNATNGIEHFFSKNVTTENLCVKDSEGETCITRSQLNALLQNQNPGGGSGGGGTPPPPPTCTSPQTLDVATNTCVDPTSPPTDGGGSNGDTGGGAPPAEQPPQGDTPPAQ